MKTKEAIELINHVSWNAFGNYGYDNNREEMIELLKRSEKYKQMWEGFKKENQYAQLDRKYPNEPIGLEMLMKEFEQKYLKEE